MTKSPAQTDHLVAGKRFLANNAKKSGVRVTKSGLQYLILQKGRGAKPKAHDSVTTHYRGTLIDGTEFDSSYQRNEPTSFALNQVIAGWTEALQLMHIGSKLKLFIPEHLAYGEASPSADIPAHASLIFEIELLDIQRA